MLRPNQLSHMPEASRTLYYEVICSITEQAGQLGPDELMDLTVGDIRQAAEAARDAANTLAMERGVEWAELGLGILVLVEATDIYQAAHQMATRVFGDLRKRIVERRTWELVSLRGLVARYGSVEKIPKYIPAF